MVRFLCRFQQVDVNLGPGYKNLTLNHRFLPFKPDTLTALDLTHGRWQDVALVIARNQLVGAK